MSLRMFPIEPKLIFKKNYFRCLQLPPLFVPVKVSVLLFHEEEDYLVQDKLCDVEKTLVSFCLQKLSYLIDSFVFAPFGLSLRYCYF